MTPADIALVFERYFPVNHATLLKGMVLGIDIEKNTELYSDLGAAGFLHIVVLSGSNIALLISLISLLTFFVVGRQMGIAITLCTLVVFIAFVGFEPPIVRAGVSGTIRLLGSFIGRTVHPLFMIFLTIFSILIVTPEWVSSLSFHLSCASATAITLLQYPKLLFGENSEQKTSLSTFCVYIREEFLISLTAYIATLPIIVIHFHVISVLSPFTNTFISWVTGPIAVFGLIFLIVEPISSDLALLITHLLYPLVSFILIIAKASGQFPYPFLEI